MNRNPSRIQRRDVLLGAAAAGLGLACGSSWAQASAWPAKPVNLVVPFPAGGGTDTFARPLAAQFAKTTGKTLVIDNRGGAGGTLGAGIAAKAARDFARADARWADSSLPQARPERSDSGTKRESHSFSGSWSARRR